MEVRSVSSFVVFLLLSPALCYPQSPASLCGPGIGAADCPFFRLTSQHQILLPGDATLQRYRVLGASAEPTTNNPPDSPSTALLPENLRPGFQWRQALTESLTFLVIEQAYVVHTDFRWVVSENGVPFNHYWRDYTQSLSAWAHSGWNDGDPNWFGYVGHPIQGALTGFIQIQNDPRSQRLEFSNTKEYWWSRFKAFLWNAAYSTQWNLGPMSEVTAEKYGAKIRAPWSYNGTYPCFHHCLTGVGQIDIVMTPLGGTGWLIGEDILDREIVRRVEEHTSNRFLIDTVRTALNPMRAGANMLHGRHPWYRASRDFQKIDSLGDAKPAFAAAETPSFSPLNHGAIFFGYSYFGGAHCERPIVESTTCDSGSAAISDLSGWNVSFEKKYLRYFGAVADFGGQYGSTNQYDYLIGVRGGASIGRVRPFAQALFGAVRTSTASISDTSFAEDLGVGADFRMTRLLSWRNQADEIQPGFLSLQRWNLRISSGLAIYF